MEAVGGGLLAGCHGDGEVYTSTEYCEWVNALTSQPINDSQSRYQSVSLRGGYPSGVPWQSLLMLL